MKNLNLKLLIGRPNLAQKDWAWQRSLPRLNEARRAKLSLAARLDVCLALWCAPSTFCVRKTSYHEKLYSPIEGSSSTTLQPPK